MRFGLDWYGGDGNHVPDIQRAVRYGMRFGLRKVYQSPYGPDVGFEADWRAMGDAGIPRGMYIFPDLRPEAPSPEVQINFADSRLVAAGGMRSTDFAPGFDVEFGGRPPPPHVIEKLEAFVLAMRARWGCWPICYTSARVVDDVDVDCLRSPATWIYRRCPLWDKTGYILPVRTRLVEKNDGVISYLNAGQPTGAPKVPRGWQRAPAPGAWINQYLGDALGVPGFPGTVDVNRFLGMNRAAHDYRTVWLRAQLGLAAPTSLVEPYAWDDDLDNAVRALQSSAGLAVDGDVGPSTFAVVSRLPGAAAGDAAL